MKVAEFENMSVTIPMEDGETLEEIDEKVFEALNALGEHVVISYRLKMKEYEERI